MPRELRAGNTWYTALRISTAIYYVTESVIARSRKTQHLRHKKCDYLPWGVVVKKRSCMTSHWFSSGLEHKQVFGAKLTILSVFQALGISDLKDYRHELWSEISIFAHFDIYFIIIWSFSIKTSSTCKIKGRGSVAMTLNPGDGLPARPLISWV